ncbi:MULTISPECIES: flagellar protein FlaG [Kordiimonas]|jgi:flagellar protein FlaG|uniref:FlaG protein n=1 Tax=Kordiimonas lacus TaxID=637679 RepID=A0A1G6VWN6_9PROT|nr:MULTISPECIES: flagellar protein FlaG [Kordiimonas]SDD58042.1 FlaG protein [Kordiimonas lacus]
MTEIGKISSSAQVVDLRGAKTAKPASNDVDRLTGIKAQSGQTSGAEPLSHIEKKAQNANATPLERAAEALQSFLPEEEQAPNTRLRIDKDDETGRFVYKNIDTESGEVIKQFPPESILEFLSYYRHVAGLAVDDKA